MARRAREDPQVSLFPFMSILACLIGILTLMISVSMQINQKQVGQSEEEVERAKSNKKLKDEAVKLEKEIKKLQEKAEKELKAQSEMQKLEQQIKVLTSKKEDLPDAPEMTPEELQQIIVLVNKETVDIKKEQPELKAELARLKAELAKLKDIPPPKDIVKISPPKLGSSIPRNLWFIECNSTGLVIRGPDDKQTLVSTAAIPNNLEFLETLTKVERMGQTQAMVVYLMRKDGRLAYDWAAGIAETKFKVRAGRIPIAHDAPIDLSAFKLK